MSNTVVPGTSDDKEVISSLLGTPGPSNFLFVNETSDAPPYKPGTRHDIRSHVRKYSSKQFTETHKTARKRVTTRPKYAPLTAQNLGSSAPCYLECYKDCRSPKVRRLGFSTQDPDSLSKASTLIELNERPYCTTPPSVVAKTLEPSGLPEELTTYCKACGQSFDRPKFKQRHFSKDRSLIPTTMWKMPIEALGASRIDPFSSLPMDKPSRSSLELMNHGACNLP
jgi:hypothetical protein